MSRGLLYAAEATSRFMVGLYRLATEQGLGYDRAITEMKRSFIAAEDRYSQSFCWAALVYYGR